MEIKIVNKSKNELPEYATIGAAGMDLRASLPTRKDILEKGIEEFKVIGENFDFTFATGNGGIVNIHPNGRVLIPTGIYVAIPEGYHADVRPRSGLALKNGITCGNSPGLIDSDYRGEVGIILINHGSKTFSIVNGDRIAQLVIMAHEHAAPVQVETLDDTARGEGGFGHTGEK